MVVEDVVTVAPVFAVVEDVVVVVSVGLLVGNEDGEPVGEGVPPTGAIVGPRVGDDDGEAVFVIVHGPPWQHVPQYASLLPQ